MDTGLVKLLLETLKSFNKKWLNYHQFNTAYADGANAAVAMNAGQAWYQCADALRVCLQHFPYHAGYTRKALAEG